jgi:hypothetical protein
MTSLASRVFTRLVTGWKPSNNANQSFSGGRHHHQNTQLRDLVVSEQELLDSTTINQEHTLIENDQVSNSSNTSELINLSTLNNNTNNLYYAINDGNSAVSNNNNNNSSAATEIHSPLNETTNLITLEIMDVNILNQNNSSSADQHRRRQRSEPRLNNQSNTNGNNSQSALSSSSRRTRRRTSNTLRRAFHNITRTNSTQSAASTASSTTSSSSDSSNLLNLASNQYDLFNGIINKRERNLLSACCSIFCIAILAVSLVETRWFYLNGGGCNVNYLGVAHFFAPGRLEYQIDRSKVSKDVDIVVYNFYMSNGFGELIEKNSFRTFCLSFNFQRLICIFLSYGKDFLRFLKK